MKQWELRHFQVYIVKFLWNHYTESITATEWKKPFSPFSTQQEMLQ